MKIFRRYIGCIVKNPVFFALYAAVLLTVYPVFKIGEWLVSDGDLLCFFRYLYSYLLYALEDLSDLFYPNGFRWMVTGFFSNFLDKYLPFLRKYEFSFVLFVLLFPLIVKMKKVGKIACVLFAGIFVFGFLLLMLYLNRPYHYYI